MVFGSGIGQLCNILRLWLPTYLLLVCNRPKTRMNGGKWWIVNHQTIVFIVNTSSNSCSWFIMVCDKILSNNHNSIKKQLLLVLAVSYPQHLNPRSRAQVAAHLHRRRKLQNAIGQHQLVVVLVLFVGYQNSSDCFGGFMCFLWLFWVRCWFVSGATVFCRFWQGSETCPIGITHRRHNPGLEGQSLQAGDQQELGLGGANSTPKPQKKHTVESWGTGAHCQGHCILVQLRWQHGPSDKGQDIPHMVGDFWS